MHQNVTETVLSFLNRQSKIKVTRTSIALVFVVGTIDVQTGLEAQLHFLYVVSIALASWFVNRQTGIYVALLCAVVILAADAIGSRQCSSRWILHCGASWSFPSTMQHSGCCSPRI